MMGSLVSAQAHNYFTFVTNQFNKEAFAANGTDELGMWRSKGIRFLWLMQMTISKKNPALAPMGAAGLFLFNIEEQIPPRGRE